MKRLRRITTRDERRHRAYQRIARMIEAEGVPCSSEEAMNLWLDYCDCMNTEWEAPPESDYDLWQILMDYIQEY
jgi:hypothetical protein